MRQLSLKQFFGEYLFLLQTQEPVVIDVRGEPFVSVYLPGSRTIPIDLTIIERRKIWDFCQDHDEWLESPRDCIILDDEGVPVIYLISNEGCILQEIASRDSLGEMPSLDEAVNFVQCMIEGMILAESAPDEFDGRYVTFQREDQ